jgi:hypothetical protein
MSAVSLWITVIAIVLIVAYLVAPGSQAGSVIKAFGNASAQNIRALAGGAYVAGSPSHTAVYQS